MNRFCFISVVLFIVGFIFSSCDEGAFKENVEWVKIDFVNEGAICAVHGELEGYLLVSTISKILRSDNGGKTWTRVANTSDPIGNFFTVNEDVYAVSNSVDYVSHDQGQSWESIAFDYEVLRASGTLTDSKGTLYEIVHHHDGELALPTTLLRSADKGNSWEPIFPYEHVFYSSHIDVRDRLYIGTWGAMWDGTSFRDSPQNTAYLYYTK